MAPWSTLGAAALLGWAAVLCRADFRDLRLPNTLTLPGAAVILTAAALAGRGVPAVCGAAVLGGAYLAVHVMLPAGLGGGDVKLALGLGALTGAVGIETWVVAALAAPALTACLGVAAAVCGHRRPIPHGPSMLVASLAPAALAVL